MRFIILKKEQNNYSKCFAFASSAYLNLLNPAVFVDGGGGGVFLAPGRRVP